LPSREALAAGSGLRQPGPLAHFSRDFFATIAIFLVNGSQKLLPDPSVLLHASNRERGGSSDVSSPEAIKQNQPCSSARWPQETQAGKNAAKSVGEGKKNVGEDKAVSAGNPLNGGKT
jgi:hypothetical protein